jgi:hypothetical protein
LTFADLEIGLHRSDVDSYRIELRFSQSESDAEPIGDRREQETSPDFDEPLRATTLEAQSPNL